MLNELGQIEVTDVPPGLGGKGVVEEGDVVPFVDTFSGGVVFLVGDTTYRAPTGTYDVVDVNEENVPAGVVQNG